MTGLTPPENESQVNKEPYEYPSARRYGAGEGIMSEDARLTEGERLAAKVARWLASDEGARCQSPEGAHGKYLTNRLWNAYTAGWNDAKKDSTIHAAEQGKG